METILHKIEYWPKDDEGDIVFKGTEDAILYATLICNVSDRINEIKQLRKKYLIKVNNYMKLHNPDFDCMMETACRGQFYRECLEEVQRLNDLDYIIN